MLNIKHLLLFILIWIILPAKAQDTLSLDGIISIIEKENQELKYFDYKIL